LKYMRPKKTFLSVVTLMAVGGVTIGVMVLVVVISVMSGFDRMWQEKIFGFRSHIHVGGFGVLEQPETIMEQIDEVEGIVSSAPMIRGLTMVNFRGRIFTPFVKGLDPAQSNANHFIAESMLPGSDFSLDDEHVMLGRDLARQMGVRVGDTMLVYSPENLINKDDLILPEELTVAGIYEIGMYDFDMGFILTSLDIARDLCGLDEGVHGIEVITDDAMKAPAYVDALRAVLGPVYDLRTWMDLHRHLFMALRVEKEMMFFLLSFIILVATFCITSIMITTTYQKIREIGLLKALGFSSWQISGVYLWQGFMLGLAGTLIGIAAGLLVLEFRNEILLALSSGFGIDLLPKNLYQLSRIPAHTTPGDILRIAGITTLFCTLSGVVTAAIAATWEPMKALRHQ
ncbi:MAG: FtsX-like permease family protein, partial [Verrucomicrobiota bacterium]